MLFAVNLQDFCCAGLIARRRQNPDESPDFIRSPITSHERLCTNDFALSDHEFNQFCFDRWRTILPIESAQRRLVIKFDIGVGDYSTNISHRPFRIAVGQNRDARQQARQIADGRLSDCEIAEHPLLFRRIFERLDGCLRADQVAFLHLCPRHRRSNGMTWVQPPSFIHQAWKLVRHRKRALRVVATDLLRRNLLHRLPTIVPVSAHRERMIPHVFSGLPLRSKVCFLLVFDPSLPHVFVGWL